MLTGIEQLSLTLREHLKIPKWTARQHCLELDGSTRAPKFKQPTCEDSGPRLHSRRAIRGPEASKIGERIEITEHSSNYVGVAMQILTRPPNRVS